MAEGARQAKVEDSARATVRSSEPARSSLSRSALDGSRSTLLSPRKIQPSLRVSQPSDASEVEAERVARAVVSMPDAAPMATQRSSSILHRAPAAARPAKAADKAAGADAEVEKDVRKAATGGAALPVRTRKLLEPRFRANFAGVRIHTDAKAAGLSAKLGARAFTFGNHIFFAGGAYDPDSKDGLELLAHELTHTIQQGETIQRKADDSADTRVHQRTERQASRLGLSDALDYFADAANAIPGYRMFTILIGVNPINMSSVEASAANILRAIVEFLPGGNVITRVLDSYGIFDKVGGWIEGQLKSLGISGASIKAAIDKFLDSLSWRDIFHLGRVWDRAKAIFTDPIGRIIAFAKSLFSEILRMVREAVLRPLAALAEGSAGYPLMKVVLGFDPITGEAVEPTADAVIGGLMTLIGQEELWANIKRAKAIPRAWAWFKGAMGGLKALVTSIPSRFIGALKSLEIMDFVVLPSAFIKLAKVFGNFLADFGGWALGTVIDLLKIIVEVVAPGAMPYIAKAGAAFNKILKNPVGFVQTLVRAGKLGLNQFAGNFLTHLKASLIGWLTGAMGGAGIYIPQGFSLTEILKFVLSVLGLTWTHLRPRLVALSSETIVKGLEEGFSLVKTLVKEGPAAAWEQIVATIGNLKDMVIEQVIAFVKSKVVEAAISKLAMMLSPAGAVIQAIISIYNTVMFFVERLQQIAQVAASFIDSIATIAAGNVGPAANRVEKTMAGLLTLVISFLARFAGLGKVSTIVNNLIEKVRAPIFKAFDRVAAWVIEQAKKLGKMLASKVGGKDERTPEQKMADLQKAVREIRPQADAFLAKNPSQRKLNAQLNRWKKQYKLTSLTLTGNSIIAKINPEAPLTNAEHKKIGLLLEPILIRVEQAYLSAAKGQEEAFQNDPVSRGVAERAARAAAPPPAPKKVKAGTPPAPEPEVFQGPALPRPNATARDVMKIRSRRENPESAPSSEMLDTGHKIEYYRNRANSAEYYVRPLNKGEASYEDMVIPGGTVSNLPVDQRTILVLEQARSRGNVAAAQVAHAMVDLGIPDVADNARIVQGDLNALAHGGSGGKADKQSFRGEPIKAANKRHAGISRIFAALRSLLNKPTNEVLSKPGGAALLDLASAFDTWIKAAMPDKKKLKDDAAIQAAEKQLESQLSNFINQRLGE